MAAPISAAIMAGGTWKGMSPEGISRWRALAPLNGRPMIHYVAQAVENCPRIGERFLIGPPEVGAELPQLERLDLTDSLTGNVRSVAERARRGQRLLLVGSDLPLLSAGAISDFVDRCSDPSTQLFYSIIEKRVVEQRFSGMRRTYATLADGTFTGGNLILSDPEFLLAIESTVRDLYAIRKNPVALARRLGISLLVRFAITHFLRLPLLNVDVAGKLVGQAVSGKVAGVPVASPEIGADLDSPDEIPYYEKLLKEQAESAGG